MNRRFVPAAAAVFGLLALAAPAVHARRQQQPFSDVPANHWAAESVIKLAARGIVTGCSDADILEHVRAAVSRKPVQSDFEGRLYKGGSLRIMAQIGG